MIRKWQLKLKLLNQVVSKYFFFSLNKAILPKENRQSKRLFIDSVLIHKLNHDLTEFCFEMSKWPHLRMNLKRNWFHALNFSHKFDRIKERPLLFNTPKESRVKIIDIYSNFLSNWLKIVSVVNLLRQQKEWTHSVCVNDRKQIWLFVELTWAWDTEFARSECVRERQLLNITSKSHRHTNSG